ncbi:MAG: alpha/beta hydrolase, partial [Mycobacterium sp.]
MTAVATIVGASARRSMIQRATTREDHYADEDFETIDDDRSYVVTTPDGVPLAVREAGPIDARVTMV